MAFTKSLAEMEQSVPDSLARRRLASLFDEGSFIELDKFVSSQGGLCPVIAGYGTVLGTSVYAFAQDAEIRSGGVNKSAALKIKKTYELAAKNGVPVIGIFDSNGGEITDGMSVLDAYGDIIKASAAVSGVVIQAAVICGVCAGAAAIVASMADFTVMTEKAELFMTSPFNTPDGKLAGAGSALNAAKSGVCDILAKDDEDALNKVKQLISMLPANNISPAGNDGFTENDTEITENMHGTEVVSAIADKGSLVELGKEFGSAAYTGLGSLNWNTIAFVATDKAAKLTANDCAKIARFIAFADAFSIPVVTVIDTEGFEPSSAAELSGSVRDCAKLAQIYASSTTIKINLIKGKAYGAAFTAFDSADITYAWENSKIAAMSPEAAKVFTGEEIDASPFCAASIGMTDGVISASDTRESINAAVEMCSGKRVSAPSRKHINFVF